MRPLLFLPLLALLTGCPSWFAPQPSTGTSAGSPCSADVECAAGLACECGVCAAPSGQPPRCITLDDACGDEPSDCFAACGDLTVVGSAACVGGRETCSDVDGVLRSQCDDDICWGEPAPGEVCLGGQLECQFGRSTATGLCYTFDCEGDAGDCVAACGDGSTPTAQICLGGEWRCESGVDAEACGACVGAPPACFLSCDNLTAVGTAACNATTLAWSCSHIVQNGTPATVADVCCASDPILHDVGDVEALAGRTCVLGTLAIGSGSATDVVLPDLKLVTRDVFVSSSTLASLSLPALERVGRTLQVESNPELSLFEAPALESIGTGFYFVANPQLSTCDIEALLVQVEAAGSIPIVQVSANGACVDGGVPDDAGDPGGTDAGLVDGGLLDGGDDAGTLDGDAGDAG